jgi:hypothetical protein
MQKTLLILSKNKTTAENRRHRDHQHKEDTKAQQTASRANAQA